MSPSPTRSASHRELVEVSYPVPTVQTGGTHVRTRRRDHGTTDRRRRTPSRRRRDQERPVDARYADRRPASPDRRARSGWHDHARTDRRARPGRDRPRCHPRRDHRRPAARHRHRRRARRRGRDRRAAGTVSVAEVRKLLAALAAIITQIIAANVLDGTALVVAQVVLAVVGAATVYLLPNEQPAN